MENELHASKETIERLMNQFTYVNEDNKIIKEDLDKTEERWDKSQTKRKELERKFFLFLRLISILVYRTHCEFKIKWTNL